MSTLQEYNKLPWWTSMRMYWLEKHIVITFQSDVPYSAQPSVDTIIDSLKLDALAQFLSMRGFKLSSFTAPQAAYPEGKGADTSMQATIKQLDAEIATFETDLRTPGNDADTQKTVVALENAIAEREKAIGELQQANNGTDTPSSDYESALDLASTTGKYLFPSPSGHGTMVVGFFNVESFDMGYAVQDMRELREMGSSSYSVTNRAVNLINNNLPRIRREGNVPIVSAAPNWLGSATPIGCTTGGGPSVPPTPIPSADESSTTPGRWPITVPVLSTPRLADKQGEGVTVFVLDTMPGEVSGPGKTPTAVTQAAGEVGTHNQLLSTIASQMNREQAPYIKTHYQEVPAALAEDAYYLFATGRDINGKPYGFSMADHGLFVTGIIRDIAPGANIEYIRVLNDFGVCDTCQLVATLNAIQNRLTDPNDLLGKPVVINLSLLVSPGDDDLAPLWMGDSYGNSDGLARMVYDLTLLRSPLHLVIQGLAAHGAVIVAAAGNDSNRPDTPRRLGPDYPAAFPEVISVGAVNREGEPAMYSNYPQLTPHHNGIATYGGDIPTLASLTSDKDVDAVRGVYSSSRYPALTAESADPYYEAANHHWAYWSGTSFATPIVSAVAARILQLNADSVPVYQRAAEVQRLLTTIAGQQELFGQALERQSEYGVSLLRAEQGCQPADLQAVRATGEQTTVHA